MDTSIEDEAITTHLSARQWLYDPCLGVASNILHQRDSDFALISNELNAICDELALDVGAEIVTRGARGDYGSATRYAVLKALGKLVGHL